jgi:hypothetical protein
MRNAVRMIRGRLAAGLLLGLLGVALSGCGVTGTWKVDKLHPGDAPKCVRHHRDDPQ